MRNRLENIVWGITGEVLEQRFVRLQPENAFVGTAEITDVSSLTDRTRLFDLAPSGAEQASTQWSFAPMSLTKIANLQLEDMPVVPPDPPLQKDVKTVRLLTWLHEFGHLSAWWTTRHVNVGQSEIVDDAYVRVIRNTLAHSFSSQDEEKRTNERVKAITFLSRLNRLIEEQEKERLVMRMIYNNLYRFRMDEEYGLCDRILEQLDVRRLTPSLLAAILTVTAAIRDYLQQRAAFFKRAMEEIVRVRGEQAAKQILIGLE